MYWFLFQTLDSDDLAPLTVDLSDLIRALSDLCIQAYQQLLSITEKRLQNIIGTAIIKTTLMLWVSTLHFLLSSPLLLPLPFSPCYAGEWDHPRSLCLHGEVGSVQKASRLWPPACGRRCSLDGGGAEGAGGAAHRPVPSGSAPLSDGAGLPPAHLLNLHLRSQQPAAEERHVLLEPRHADTVEKYADTVYIHIYYSICSLEYEIL